MRREDAGLRRDGKIGIHSAVDGCVRSGGIFVGARREGFFSKCQFVSPGDNRYIGRVDGD